MLSEKFRVRRGTSYEDSEMSWKCHEIANGMDSMEGLGEVYTLNGIIKYVRTYT
jgi:hypothetical protein